MKRKITQKWFILLFFLNIVSTYAQNDIATLPKNQIVPLVNNGTNFSGVSVESSQGGLVTSYDHWDNKENAIDSDLTDFAVGDNDLTIKPLAGVVFPKGTYVGAHIRTDNGLLGNLLDFLGISLLDLFNDVTITTYLNGTLQESKSIDESSGLNLLDLNVSDPYNAGLVTTTDYDEIKIAYSAPVDVSLGGYYVNYPIVKKYCSNDDTLNCNTQVPWTNTDYPVEVKTVTTGLVGAGNTITGLDNIINNNTADYAELGLDVSLASDLEIGVYDVLDNYTGANFVGFDIEVASIADVNLLNNIVISTYKDGSNTAVETASGSSILLGVPLLTASSKQTIGFLATQEFDEVRIKFSSTLNANVGSIKIYNSFIKGMCPTDLECNTSYNLSSPSFSTYVDFTQTGVSGAACVDCNVENANNVLTSDNTDYATLDAAVSVGGSVSIAVRDATNIYPAGSYAGFNVSFYNSLLSLDLLYDAITITTLKDDGTVLETASGKDLIGLDLLGGTILGTNLPGNVNVGFKTTQAFHGIKITATKFVDVDLSGVLGASEIDVYGAFVDTRGATGGIFTACLVDADNDGIPDSIDLDDDNDGILDIEEQGCLTSSSVYSSIYDIDTEFSSHDPGSASTSIETSDGVGLEFRSTEQYVILELNVTENVPSGTIISIEARKGNSDPSRNSGFIISQSVNGTDFTNSVSYIGSWTDAFKTESYTLVGEAKYIKISSEIDHWAMFLDYVEVGAFVNTVCNETLDSDGDGTPNHLDLDSDDDGCSDALEAGATTDTTTNYQFIGAVGPDGVPDAVQTTSGVNSGLVDYHVIGTNFNNPHFLDEDISYACFNSLDCSTDAYQVTNGYDLLGDGVKKNSVWQTIDLVTGDVVTEDDDSDVVINAIGYNPKDGKIWGVSKESDDLTVTSKDDLGNWKTQSITITGIDNTITYNVGDINKDGHFYIMNGKSDIIKVIDLDPASITYLQVIETINIVASKVSDFAFHPGNGDLYTIVKNATDDLIQIKTDGTITNLGASGVPTGTAFGAVFFDNAGFFYAFKNNDGKIYRLDLSNPPATDYDETATTFFSQATTSNNNDGARCTDGSIYVDYGDAPDLATGASEGNYNTLLSNDGPRHTVLNYSPSAFVSSLMLGAQVSAGIGPILSGSGDSYDDGVIWPNSLEAGTEYTQNITITNNTSGDAYLNVWIDFNRDGDFTDAGEQLANDQVVADNATTASVTFTVPEALAGVGVSYARVRLSQNQGESNSPIGPAIGGEVEDYLINLTDASAIGAAMITQVYQYGGERWIEVTNISDEDIPGNVIKVQLYNEKSGDQTGVAPDVTYTVTTVLASGESVLFKRSTSVIANTRSTATIVQNNPLVKIIGGDDIITLSTTTDETSWANRYDVVSNIENKTSVVRIDDVEVPNDTYTASEWIVFIDEAIKTYSNQIDADTERHAHAPLLQEIGTANAEANIRLGLHRVKLTDRITDPNNGSNTIWSNGYPDRSREVVVSEDYNHLEKLSARSLEVKSNTVFSVTDHLLVVTNTVALDGQIRLVSTDDTNKAQLVQTHDGIGQITGSGTLLVDQKSMVPSMYRYNYMSSPVNIIGENSYTIESVLKDGSNPLSHDGIIGQGANNIAKDIKFIDGYNGAYSADSISIADYWVYTYVSGSSGRSNWEHKYKNQPISETDGFIFKGPNRSQNYTYVGSPKDGELQTSVGANESYLVGNPYPGAISAKKFIEDNENTITGSLYFWEHAGEEAGWGTAGHNFGGYVGGYAVRNIAMGLAANSPDNKSNENSGISGLGNGNYKEPAAYIAMGQGFFVGGDDSGGPIVFNNSQREYVTEGTESIFYKSNNNSKEEKESVVNNLPIIKLGMDYVNEEGLELHRQIGISFKNENSFEFDKGYDAAMLDVGETDLYWKFPNNDDKYVITGVQSISDALEVPLYLSLAQDGTVVIGIDEWNAIDRDVYLTDKLTNTSYLLNQEKVSLTLTNGKYTERFVLAFSKSTTLSVEDDILEGNVSVFLDNTAKELVVKNGSNLAIQKVTLFNLLGQEVHQWLHLEQSAEEVRLKIINLANAIYIVNVETEKGKVSKKIILE